MICKKCGADIGENRFCPQCGTPANAGPAQQRKGNPTKVLVFGIIGLALCSTGFLGLIFSVIGLVQASRYRAQYGTISKQANIGRGLAIAGLILSILCLIVYVICVIVLINNWPAIERALQEAAAKSGGRYTYTFNY